MKAYRQLFLLLVLVTAFSSQLNAQAPVYEPFNVDSIAAPKGGMSMLETFLWANLQKPFMARVANITGKVFLKAVVEADGRLSDVTVVRGLRPDCDREAMRAMRLFNAWKPAYKDSKPVRQALNYAVLFRANEPTLYEQGKAIVYYDANFRPITNALTATYQHTLPIDTLTGLPNGELTVYETRNGKRGKEVKRFPLIRKEIKAPEPGEGPLYQLGHKQETSDWVNLIYTIRADGSLVSVGPPDRTEGMTVTYRPNGLVESIQDFSAKKVTSWFPDGQLKTIVVESPADIKYTKAYYRLVSAWDSTGKATVVDGNGYRMYQSEVTSRSDSTKKTVFVEEGAYVDGYHDGIWKGRYADGSYSYEEQFNQGQCLGGKAVINGTATTYKDARKDPEFKGGLQALYAFLGQTIRYPSDASRQGVSGKVFVTFTVCTDGTLCDYEVLKGVYPSLDAEALRVVKEASGRWNPGFQRGEAIRVKYNLPISFQFN